MGNGYNRLEVSLISYFLQGASLGFSASVTPGPFLAFLLGQTLKNGWRRTLPASLAPLFSDGPIVALVLLVLTQTPGWFLIALQIMGSLLILYLAKEALVSWSTADLTAPISDEATRQSLLKATLINMLSPAPYLFWSMIAGPIVLAGWRESPGLGLSFVLGFYGALMGGFAGLIILFATAQRAAPNINKQLSGISALVLFSFGLYQLISGLINLL